MVKQKTFEERLARLQYIVDALDNPELSLQDSMNLFREGMELSKICSNELETTKHEVQTIINGQINPLSQDIIIEEKI